MVKFVNRISPFVLGAAFFFVCQFISAESATLSDQREAAPAAETEGTVSGTVEAVDGQNGEITIATKEGGSEAFKLNEDTVIWRGDDIIGLEDIVVGEEVGLEYYTLEGEKVVDWVDARIKEGPGSSAARPSEEEISPSEEEAALDSIEGRITGINAEEGRISVVDEEGKTYEFMVTDEDTLIWKGDDILEISGLHSEDSVQIDYFKDAEGAFMASWIDIVTEAPETSEAPEEMPAPQTR